MESVYVSVTVSLPVCVNVTFAPSHVIEKISFCAQLLNADPETADPSLLN